MVFRVCGYKEIACQYGFVYTQTLLASIFFAWQAWVLTMICGYIGNLFLTALTMFISAKTKSSVIAVTTPFVIMFIPSFLQGMTDWLDTVIAMMPVSLLEFYQHLGTFDLITIFGKVFRVMDVSLPLYAILTVTLVPVIYREFRRKQIV